MRRNSWRPPILLCSYSLLGCCTTTPGWWPGPRSPGGRWPPSWVCKCRWDHLALVESICFKGRKWWCSLWASSRRTRWNKKLAFYNKLKNVPKPMHHTVMRWWHGHLQHLWENNGWASQSKHPMNQITHQVDGMWPGGSSQCACFKEKTNPCFTTYTVLAAAAFMSGLWLKIYYLTSSHGTANWSLSRIPT